MRLGVVAGEASGDVLGAGVIQALRERVPGLTVEGIGGPRMAAEGCRNLYPMERLSVMGLVEVVGHLPDLYRIRSGLTRHFLDHPPDVFLGIDAPDFNLTLEQTLRRRGIKTAHYVSPTVWAWRRYRIRKIKRAVDRMLVLFPFEAGFYEGHGVPVTCVGHPLADLIGFDVDRAGARTGVGLSGQGEVLALLPGSRVAEVKGLAGPFIEAARRCRERRPDMRFIAPMANPSVRRVFEGALQDAAQGAPPITLTDGDAHQAMAAADMVLAAGGTAVLEAMLLQRPVVMAYKIAPLSYWLARHLVKIRTFSLPNLLAGEPLVPEFIQERVTGANLAGAVLDLLEQPRHTARVRDEFARLHRELRRDANRQAAAAIQALAAGPGGGTKVL